MVACIPCGEHEASQNAVKVSWSNNETSRCRPGIDVICIEEMPGLSYYRDHLPVLGNITLIVMPFEITILVFGLYQDIF